MHDFEFTRSQRACGSTASSDAVELKPAGLLPGEHELIMCRPQQILARQRRLEDAPGAVVRSPDAPPVPAEHIGYPNGPGLPCPAGNERRSAFRGHANEGNLRPARRKHSRGVLVQARALPDNGLVGEVIYAEQGMIAAVTDEREVGRIR